MKINVLVIVALVVSMTLTACDDTTDSTGTSITDTKDLLAVTSATYPVKSSSVNAGAVYARNTTGYVGKVRDPETNPASYVTGNFMTQFHTFEDSFEDSFEGYTFPKLDSIVVNHDGVQTFICDIHKKNGEKLTEREKIDFIKVDSCTVGLYYTEFYGDSLANMTLTMHELAEPMKEGVKYYSNFDPMTLVRADGIKKDKTYTLTDLSVSEDDRSDDTYMASIAIKLNDLYTDKDGNKYDNYGQYIMKKYYEHPEYFKNSYEFINNVCPGFYFKNKAGLGSMAYISVSQLNVYFKYGDKVQSTDRDTIYVGVSNFSGTEEVLQSTNIENKNIENLISGDQEYTYVKSPAGIFTELELPVDDILAGHENDTLNTAKVVLTKMNNTTDSKYAFSEPSTLLLLPTDSLQTFFEGEQLPDYKTSYIATNSSSASTDYGTYTFNNIAGLITRMGAIKEQGLAEDPDWLTKHPNWNKALVVPVSATYTTQSSSYVLVKVVHDMSLSNIRLVKGTGNEDEIKISVIYSKFDKQ